MGEKKPLRHGQALYKQVIFLMKYNFELGPIRPPSEGNSILLRLVRNCPWNKCHFCSVYKDKKFSLRTVGEIKKDIDSICFIRDRLTENFQKFGHKRFNHSVTDEIIKELDMPLYEIRKIAFWIYKGMRSVFLQDGDPLVLKSHKLIEILSYIKEKFPSVKRITAYSRSRTMKAKSLEEMKEIREAGLTRIHTGLESGSDKILKLMRKGVTPEEQIEGGRKAVKAGFELSEYYMPGLGGKDLLRENAIKTAEILNKINPSFIRLRSVIPYEGTALYDLMIDKKWHFPSEEEKVREIKLFLENLKSPLSQVASDHNLNLLEDLKGTLPKDKAKMLELINTFLSLSPEEKESFITGKRFHFYRYLSDFEYSEEVEKLKKKLKKNYSSIDEGLLFKALQSVL